MTQAEFNDVQAVRDADPATLAEAKRVVLEFNAELDASPTDAIASTIARFAHDDYSWRGVRPFYELNGVSGVAETFWTPLRRSFSPIQRRPDVFLSGANVVDDGESIWTCEMGHFLGLFDEAWLDIRPTRRMCFLRFAEFHRVVDGKIAETALFLDVVSVMRQAGQYPLPPQTGAAHIHPGPLTHDGVMLDVADAETSATTLQLVHKMGSGLNEANRVAEEHGDDRMPASVLAKTWHDDMIWSGPEGIGATYTIDRYQQQHQYPFRFNLTSKQFNGHVARFAEGNYACFFGWPNLTNRPTGGFLGMPASTTAADMRVVDVYRRDGDKLAENWVFIDLLHWLSMQGLDVLERMRQLNGSEI